MAKRKPRQALSVPCPFCQQLVGQVCRTLKGGEAAEAHKPRIMVEDAVRQLAKKSLRGALPGQYEVKGLISVQRSELDPSVSDESLIQARVTGRPVTDNYIVETYLSDGDLFSHVIELGNQRLELIPQVVGCMQTQRKALLSARDNDTKAYKVLERYRMEMEN